MNREQRRAMARAKPVNPREKRLSWARPRRPMLHEVELVYGPIDAFLDQLSHGEIDCTDTGVAIFRDREGHFYEAVPALEGFAEVWQVLSDRHGLSIDLTPLSQLAKRLKYSMPCDPDFVAQVARCVDLTRQAYMRMDVYDTKSVVRTQQIRIEMEELGILNV